MVSGVSELRYVSRGLTTPGHTPSAGQGENRVRGWRRIQGGGGAPPGAVPHRAKARPASWRCEATSWWGPSGRGPSSRPRRPCRRPRPLALAYTCRWKKREVRGDRKTVGVEEKSPMINSDYDIDNLFLHEAQQPCSIRSPAIKPAAQLITISSFVSLFLRWQHSETKLFKG